MPTPKPSRTLWTLALPLLALGLAAPVQLAAQQPLRIAIVDLDRVVLESKAGTELRGQLQSLQEQAQAEVDRMRAEVNALRQQIADGAATMPSGELESLREELERKLIESRRYQDDKQREADTIQQRAMSKVEVELEPIFRRLQQEEGYDLILNNVPGVVVLASPRADITRTVIERLAAASAEGAGEGG